MEVKAFAGIDVGKAAHMCCIVDAVGNVLAGSFPFANDVEGFSKLLAELRKAGRPILVGMEATGHYGEALKRFLAANGVPYAEYNPAGVLSFAKSRGTHHKKTDRADAAAIAAFASSSPPSATTTSYHPNGLKCLVRHRRSLVVRRPLLEPGRQVARRGLPGIRRLPRQGGRLRRAEGPEVGLGAGASAEMPIGPQGRLDAGIRREVALSAVARKHERLEGGRA